MIVQIAGNGLRVNLRVRIITTLDTFLEVGNGQLMDGMTKWWTLTKRLCIHFSKLIDLKPQFMAEIRYEYRLVLYGAQTKKEKCVIDSFSSTIPGVLVGHYTQLVWGPTSRIGCGKIVHRPANGPNKWGSQIFVCDYAIGGNFLRSEMYKIGDACSACPSGTSCSKVYPGLCTGNPDKPITQRPPLHSWEIEGTFPTRKPIFIKNTTSTTNNRPTEPEIISEEFIKPPKIQDGDDKCIYTCRKDKGCSVKISSNHPISGPILGSCFPPSFGGSCSGIPNDCSECIDVCKGEEGHEIIVEVSKDGKFSIL